MCLAEGNDEDPIGFESYQLGEAQSSPVPEDYGLQTARGRGVHGEVPVLQQGLPSNTQKLVHEVRDSCRSLSYNALHYQQNTSTILLRNTKGQLMIKSKQQPLLLRAVQQRMWLLDSET